MKLYFSSMDSHGAKARRRLRRISRFRRQYGRLARYFRRHATFVVALVAAVSTLPFGIMGGIYLQPMEVFDLKTLACLTCILASVGKLEKAGLFEAVARKFGRAFGGLRTTILVLVLATVVLSMFVTNDMALVAMLPLAAVVLRHESRMEALPFCMVMQNLGANLGGMILPFGNPQNLFIYSHYGLGFSEFVSVMILPFLLSMSLIVACCLVVSPFIVKGATVSRSAGGGSDEAEGVAESRSTELQAVAKIKNGASSATSKTAAGESAASAGPTAETDPIRRQERQTGELAFGFALLLTTVLAVLRVVPYPIVLVLVVVLLLAFDRQVLRSLDWTLVGTFAFFFAFAGNVSCIGWLNGIMAEGMANAPLLVSAGLSQVVSNVPAAIMLSGSTQAWQSLLVGVNIGGAGTLVASLATLITVDRYGTLRFLGGAGIAERLPSKGAFMLRIMAWGFAFLAVLCVSCLMF